MVTFDALLFQNYVKYLKNALYTCMSYNVKLELKTKIKIKANVKFCIDF